jgi:hypothetical protein
VPVFLQYYRLNFLSYLIALPAYYISLSSASVRKLTATLNAARFLIIGVQKKAPYQVWRVELTAKPGLIKQSHKKYAALLCITPASFHLLLSGI